MRSPNLTLQTEPAIRQGKEAIAFYYGRGNTDALSHYRRVVLQPDNYDGPEIAWLESQETLTYAYLSLGEDAGPSAPWHRGEVNVEWSTAYVRPLHPGWVDSRLQAAEGALAKGFSGLFLDTIDLADVYPEDRPDMLELIARINAVVEKTSILANRGFSLLPELAEHVNGIVFESFSTSWTHARPGYRVLTNVELATNGRLAHDLARYDLDLYALDYRNSLELEEFAKTRAALHGMAWFASNRAIDELPAATQAESGSDA